jgi:predicted neutral ceramidase superfamily lipid hydrolase
MKMSLEYVKAHAMNARAEKDLGKKIDAIACALEELAKSLAASATAPASAQGKKNLFG